MSEQFYKRLQGFDQEEVNQKINTFMKTKDQIIRNEIIAALLRLVMKVAHEVGVPEGASAITFEDLFQEGTIALMEALDRYDPDKKSKFITYAYVYMRGKLMTFVKEHAYTVTVPRRTVEKINSIRQERTRYVKEHGVYPSAEEVAERLGMNLEDVFQLTSFNTYSLDMPIKGNRVRGEQDMISFHDSVPDESDVEGAVLSSVFCQSFLSRFSKKQQNMMLDYYSGMTMREVATKYSCTASYVNEIIRNAKTLAKREYVGA